MKFSKLLTTFLFYVLGYEVLGMVIDAVTKGMTFDKILPSVWKHLPFAISIGAAIALYDYFNKSKKQ